MLQVVAGPVVHLLSPCTRIQELHKLEEALKKEEFRKLLVDYAKEIRDPDNRKVSHIILAIQSVTREQIRDTKRRLLNLRGREVKTSNS